MADRLVVVPAAYVYLLRTSPAPGGTEVLLQLRRGTGFMDGYWAAAVAGHVERGETAAAAARRESVEEVGVTEVDLTPWCAMQRTGRTGLAVDERVDYFFLARAWRGVPTIREPDKCADLRWFDLGSLPSPVVPHEARVLASVRNGRTPPFVSEGFGDR